MSRVRQDFTLSAGDTFPSIYYAIIIQVIVRVCARAREMRFAARIIQWHSTTNIRNEAMSGARRVVCVWVYVCVRFNGSRMWIWARLCVCVFVRVG